MSIVPKSQSIIDNFEVDSRANRNLHSHTYWEWKKRKYPSCLMPGIVRRRKAKQPRRRPRAKVENGDDDDDYGGGWGDSNERTYAKAKVFPSHLISCRSSFGRGACLHVRPPFLRPLRLASVCMGERGGWFVFLGNERGRLGRVGEMRMGAGGGKSKWIWGFSRVLLRVSSEVDPPKIKPRRQKREMRPVSPVKALPQSGGRRRRRMRGGIHF